MDYVTITKLQSKMQGEANQTTVRKLIDKMAHDGYLDIKGSRRLGNIEDQLDVWYKIRK